MRVPDLASKDFAPLNISEFNPDPVVEFSKWYHKAEEAGEAQVNAMTLATASTDGMPSARTLLLKDFKNNYFVFFTNYDSPKACDLISNPRAEMLFHWKSLHFQVRVSGSVKKTDVETSRDYFQSRPLASQISAWASMQSQTVENREELLQAREKIRARHPDQFPLPLPPFWGGYQLHPVRFEFWSERADRLHDRIAYQLIQGVWTKERLAP